MSQRPEASVKYAARAKRIARRIAEKINSRIGGTTPAHGLSSSAQVIRSVVRGTSTSSGRSVHHRYPLNSAPAMIAPTIELNRIVSTTEFHNIGASQKPN